MVTPLTLELLTKVMIFVAKKLMCEIQKKVNTGTTDQSDDIRSKEINVQDTLELLTRVMIFVAKKLMCEIPKKVNNTTKNKKLLLIYFTKNQSCF